METYRIHDDASLYFVTYSAVSWLPVFVNERACRLLTDSLVFCHGQKGVRINAYVIMPAHLHAMVAAGGMVRRPCHNSGDHFRICQPLSDSTVPKYP